MDPKVLALNDGDITKVSVDPRKRDRINPGTAPHPTRPEARQGGAMALPVVIHVHGFGPRA